MKVWNCINLFESKNYTKKCTLQKHWLAILRLLVNDNYEQNKAIFVAIRNLTAFINIKICVKFC